MDNYGFNESTAYDFDLFESKENVIRLDIPKKKNPKNDKKPLLKKAGICFMVALCIALAIMQINLNAKSTELTTEINNIESRIQDLKGESVYLNNKLDMIISSEELEQKAKELGMQKISSSQIRYLCLNDEDSAQVVDERTFVEKLLAAF